MLTCYGGGKNQYDDLGTSIGPKERRSPGPRDYGERARKTQRMEIVVTPNIFAFVALLHNPTGWGRRVYGGLCALAAAGGGAVAARHVWLQHLPPDQVPACGPSLEYMLETLPFSETLSLVLMGDGNCAETMWTFLGLSIPEQTLLLFSVVTLIALWQTFRTYPGTDHAAAGAPPAHGET